MDHVTNETTAAAPEDALRCAMSRLPWPRGGAARLETGASGGIAVMSWGDNPRDGYSSTPEAFFSDAADLILYMLDKFGTETRRKVWDAFLVAGFGRTQTVNECWPPEPDPNTEAEIPLSQRIADAVMLLRETGWVVTPDLEPKSGVARLGADPNRAKIEVHDGTIHVREG